MDVPRSLLTVTATDAMVCNSVFPVGGVPCRVNGSVTVNWPPNACEAVLWNQSVVACRISTVACEVPSVRPAAGVNCRVTEASVRVVEYPVMFSAKLLAVSFRGWTAMSTGGAAATANWSVAGELGVTSTPPDWVAKEGVRVIVLATVPVCSRICGP